MMLKTRISLRERGYRVWFKCFTRSLRLEVELDNVCTTIIFTPRKGDGRIPSFVYDKAPTGY